MNTYVNAYGMRMPARFADMTPDEIEYDGSWKFKIKWRSVRKVCIVAAIACGVAATVISCGLAAPAAATLSVTAYGALEGGAIGLGVMSGTFAVVGLYDGKRFSI